MSTKFQQTFGHLYGFVYLHSSFEAVAHIHFYENCHITACRFHHFFHHHIHKTHPVFERTAIFIFPMIGVGRQELTNQIAVPRMYFNGVKSGFPRQIDCISIRFRHFRQLLFFHSTHKRRRIEVEA